MNQKSENPKKDTEKSTPENKISTDGYPVYPEEEDIYLVGKKEDDINPDDLTRRKVKSELDKTTQLNEKGFEDDQSGDDLDIPGAELDDDQEEIGSEDEENNYYSLGGDDHNDLEEDRG
jgi:hypothetical protein